MNELPHERVDEDGARNKLRMSMGSPERRVSNSGSEATGHSGDGPRLQQCEVHMAYEWRVHEKERTFEDIKLKIDAFIAQEVAKES